MPTHTVLGRPAVLCRTCLLIALVPVFFGHFWENNRNKLIVAVVASSPALFYLLTTPHGGELLGRTAL